MGILEIVRGQLPRGFRYPDPVPNSMLDGSGQWWGPSWNQLPWSSDGSLEPTVIGSGDAGDAAAMAIPAAWRCVNMIAGVIAQMPLVMYDKVPLDEARETVSIGKDSRVGLSKVNPYPLQVLEDPWPLITYYNWMFQCVATLLLRGNFYALRADIDPATGWPRQLIPLANDDVEVNLVNGYPVYTVEGFDRTFDWLDIFHVRGFMLPGMIKGVGVIEAQRTGLANTRIQMDFGNGAYRSGGIPPVVLTVDKPELSEQEAEYLQTRWVQRHTPTDRRPAVVPKIVDVNVVGLSMQDAEYLQSRQFGIAEIAYMFNLDPNDLSAGFARGGNSMTYQNMETQMRQRLIFSMQMWISRIQEAFTHIVPGMSFVKLNADELIRSDTQTRMATYSTALQNRILTINEVRAMEGLGPVEGGDDIFNNAGPSSTDVGTGQPIDPRAAAMAADQAAQAAQDDA